MSSTLIRINTVFLNFSGKEGGFERASKEVKKKYGEKIEDRLGPAERWKKEDLEAVKDIADEIPERVLKKIRPELVSSHISHNDSLFITFFIGLGVHILSYHSLLMFCSITFSIIAIIA